jgi:cyclic beta-1,2-glucan synthetase
MTTPVLEPAAAVDLAESRSAVLFPDPYSDEPIRGELFGPEHLEAHARQLAAASVVEPRGRSRALLRRFRQDELALFRAHGRITEAYRRREAIGTDAEWLLDNFHIVTEAHREIRHDLPRGYLRELPKLATGPLARFPRVYALALNLLAHTDSSLDEGNLTRFVQAYQTVAPLTIGELWAVPTMLRLALIENLRRLSQQMLRSWNARRQAEELARRLCAPAGTAQGPDREPTADLDDACAVHLLQLLRDAHAAAAPGIEWLEARLAERGTHTTEVLRREHQRQASNQVSVGNCVTSLRLLSALDWNEFFERTSLVEAVLRDDPAGVYARQDFVTRDRYRRVVERLARGRRLSEIQVARRVVALAREAQGDTTADPITAARRAHIGYYVLDRGRAALERDLLYQPRPAERLLRAALAHPGALYFGSLFAAWVAMLAGLLGVFLGLSGSVPPAWSVVAAVVLLLPASELAVGVVNYLLTSFLPPRVLPKLEFKEGVPAECATFVVMPCMLLRPESAAALLERLEVHYLSNPEPNFYFALLTDFADAPAEHMPEDETYVRAALDGVKALNERYAGAGQDRFYLFHRPRRWNPAQGCWMGWERKRGKLREFNRLLRGARDTGFRATSGDVTRLPPIRYVLTLDADTQLPRETGKRLVAALAHPLNRPRFDPAAGRVTEGYGVLQPRVSLRLSAGTRSLFARIFAGSAGIDPYTTAVSDVYQDLFGSGTFTGKGIYQVDAFDSATGDTFRDNHILSHDLIEGNHARCGLVTDIELLDDFPARYHAYARREHRWVRGDWQILPWLFWRVPVPGGSGRNPLPLLERWKIFDNLRRSLVPPTLVLLLLLGWTLLPSSPWVWTGIALVVLAVPLLLQFLGAFLGIARGRSLGAQLGDLRAEAPGTAGQVLLGVCFLADQARLMLDAITRTLLRLTVTRRHLLEWETAASTERRLGTGFIAFFVSMWPTGVLTLAMVLAVVLFRPEALPAAALFVLPWLVSPAVAFWVSRPRERVEAPLSAVERRQLRRIACKTWSFFETFVGEEDHWLPPDNYQEDPRGQVAHRTSPTNQGLLLLSTLAAHDLGYLSLGLLVERLEKTFATLDRLERFHGHFHNWYDTRTLRSLQPGYISTVDSGNLMGCLLALKQGLREKVEEPIPSRAARDGLADTLLIVSELLRDVEPPAEERAELQAQRQRGGPDEPPMLRLMATAVAELDCLLAEDPADLPAWDGWLERFEARAQVLAEQVEALGDALGEIPEPLRRWVVSLLDQVRGRREELTAVAPWARVLRERSFATAEGATPVGSLMTGPLPPESARRWQELHRLLVTPAGVAGVQERAESVVLELQALADVAPRDFADLLRELAGAARSSSAAELGARCHNLADRAGTMAGEMNFKFLYNEQRRLFATGFNLATGRLDNSYYDLLASEARLASFLAIARGDADRRHWFQLGRQLTRMDGYLVLISWGGTMFEYLMPRLLLRGYPGTLLEESCHGAVARQIEYGRETGVPWGISESAFSALDGALDYQYQSFGVPGLGLKRGLAQDLVVAPYATGLAAIINPRRALANFRRLAAEGADAAYGFYEAIDYTRDRLLKKRRSLLVRSYMAHHQGMTLVALANCLLGGPMPRRFHAEPMVRATELLLQERVPRSAPVMQPHSDETTPAPVTRDDAHPLSRRLTTPQTTTPRTHLLSNGRYTVMLTNAGSGFSRCRGLDVTRWREDRTRDAWGQFLYIRDLRSGLLWSAGHHPVCRAADEYEVIFSADKAGFRRLDAGVETYLEITVSPENCAEVRRVIVTNHNNRAHDLEVTSYAELVLAPHGGDLAHPAFAKLFLETEFLPGQEALLCRRRPRALDEKPSWAVHVLAVDGPTVGRLQYETDRARFLGRGRSPADPGALERDAVLSGRTGPVLDPIFSLRRRLRVAPGRSVSVAFTTAMAESRDEALALADQYRDVHAVTRAFELAWAHSQVEFRHLRLSAEDAHLFQRLAAHILYAGPALRADPAILAANRQGQPGLWRHGISGDRPIVVVSLSEEEELPLLNRLLVAHAYWRLKGLEVDLVVLNEHPTSYFEEFHQRLQTLVRASDAHALIDKPGGVFLRKTAHLAEEDRILLSAAARVVLYGNRGSLASQVDRPERPPVLPPRFVAREERRSERSTRSRSRDWATPSGTGSRAPYGREVVQTEASHLVQAPLGSRGLLFANGRGGFTTDGREYLVAAASGTPPRPPAPWINVIANPSCGFLVSESGSGYTWTFNSQTNRLTPWSNDPVSDPPGEAIYLRDETTGDVWRVPSAEPGAAICRHGHGYTQFDQQAHGLAQELLLFVPPEDPVKVLRLLVRNASNEPRRLSAIFYAEWVLGTVRDQAALNLIPELDPESGALLARNAFNTDFAGRVAFADVNLRPRTLTADRTEFLGRNGSPDAPAALARVELSGRVEPGLDPCAALQTKFDVRPGQTREVIFLLGGATGVDEARKVLARYRDSKHVAASLAAVKERWQRVLTAVQVKTPDPALDLMLNGWLLYQVLGCRLWARSAFYQSGGAYGFRDQLQDVMALVYGAPEEARAQILRAAARQFLEGDVQHWWHPPAGRGVRTRISDDFLWLPFVTAHYVATTGDAVVLDEQVPFLKAPPLRPDQEEDYGLPETTAETAPLYEHCVRAIENGFRYGVHGLPLMGTGDWNDGMNRVGAGGKGESVWNGWFQITILRRFADLAEGRGEADQARRYREQAERLRAAVEEHAWDGRWYLRAWFDDGTPLGSAKNEECRIDSLSQSWAVLSGAADPERARLALAAVDELLVRRADRLIQLFAPPFDRGSLQPGYIKGYVPGIRENGGQYTHAATWVVLAFALLGDGDRAVELFDLLNPIGHAASPEAVERYKVEPYVVVADVYSEPPHIGRGGWTWYTGSAGWLYRVGLEGILGFHLRGSRLVLDPHISSKWPRYEITYRYRSATYHITVENPQGVQGGVQRLDVDGRVCDAIDLIDDGGRHEVRVVLGGERQPAAVASGGEPPESAAG